MVTKIKPINVRNAGQIIDLDVIVAGLDLG
jgi:hypothetical protein